MRKKPRDLEIFEMSHILHGHGIQYACRETWHGGTIRIKPEDVAYVRDPSKGRYNGLNDNQNTAIRKLVSKYEGTWVGLVEKIEKDLGIKLK